MRMFAKMGLIAAILVAGFLPSAATEVTVEFGPRVLKHLERLNVYEKNREIRFRDRRSAEIYQSPALWFARSTATERLIPKVEDYSIQELAARMVAYNLEHIGEHDTDHRLVIRVDDFYGEGFNISAFQGPHELVRGRISLYDGEGNQLFARDVKSYGVPVRSGGRHYYGTGHPYPAGWYSQRFDPLFAHFLDKAMSAAFPGTDVPDAITKN